MKLKTPLPVFVFLIPWKLANDQTIQFEENRFGIEPEIIAKLARTRAGIYRWHFTQWAHLQGEVRKSTGKMDSEPLCHCEI